MFGIKRRFQRCKVWPPRFKESSVWVHQIWVPPWKVRFLLLSTNLAREWLQIDRLAANHNKHCRWAFRKYQHRWPWATLNPQNRGFSEFFAILGYGVHWASEFSLKLLDIDKTTCVRNYTDAVERLVRIGSDFLFPSQVLRGQFSKKLCLRYHACLAARHLEKFDDVAHA